MTTTSTARAGMPRIGIIALTIATALIHFSLLFPDPVFIMNGLGYLGLLAGLILPHPLLDRRRRRIRWALISYTALTIVLWLAFGSRTPIAYADKVIELALIALLVIEDRRG